MIGDKPQKFPEEEGAATERSRDDKSSYHYHGGDELSEDYRKELERLQIATMYSLAEQVLLPTVPLPPALPSAPKSIGFQELKEAELDVSDLLTSRSRSATAPASSFNPRKLPAAAMIGDKPQKFPEEEGAASERSRDDRSSYHGGDELSEDYRKELERLQIATIYSLVEQVPTNVGSKMNFLFLTNSQAAEFNFSDIEKVMNAMEIKPRPKLIITIYKSGMTFGSTNSTFGSYSMEDIFSPRCYVAEKTRSSFKETERELAMFLKDHLLPVCIKTHALVFVHDRYPVRALALKTIS
jgi:Ni/Co efflux regulator RcnB